MSDRSTLIRRLRFRLLIAMALAGGGLTVASAGESATNPTARANTNLSTFRVEFRTESGPDVMSARRAYLTAGTNRFAFVVPEGFRLNRADGQEVRLVSSDNTCGLSVSLLLDPALAKPAPTECRERLLTKFPAAHILNEFSLFAAGQSGPAFDLQWAGPRDIPQAARVAFIPSRAGTLEFCLTASPEKLAKMAGELRLVMLTFCASDAQGKLEVLPLSNKL